jgi:hypothetical protein
MRELDEALIKHFKKQSKDIKNKDIIPIDGSFKFKKVAFDRFKVFGDHYEGLWKVEEISGVPHLVRASDPTFDYKTSGDWSAAADYDNSNITLSYKDIPITSFSSKEFGYQSDDVDLFKSAILEKISEDKDFVKDVLVSQSKQKVDALTKTFPELIKLYFDKE